MDTPLLLADAFESILGIIILVMAGLSQLLANRNPKQKQARPQRVPRPPGNAGQGNVGGPDDKIRKEVEDFLKRARGEQPAPQPQQVGPRPAQPNRPVAVPRLEPIGNQSEGQSRRERELRGDRGPQESKPGRLSPTHDRTSPQIPVRPKQARLPDGPPVVRLEPSLRNESVAEHVTSHMDSVQDTAERVSHLGEDVGYADERLEERLRTKFDHKLGTLQRQTEANVKKTRPNLAAEVIDLLTQPDGMQRVIIANEILKRPEF